MPFVRDVVDRRVEQPIPGALAFHCAAMYHVVHETCTTSIDVPQPREQVFDFLDVMANHEPFTNHMLKRLGVLRPRPRDRLQGPRPGQRRRPHRDRRHRGRLRRAPAEDRRAQRRPRRAAHRQRHLHARGASRRRHPDQLRVRLAAGAAQRARSPLRSSGRSCDAGTSARCSALPSSFSSLKNALQAAAQLPHAADPRIQCEPSSSRGRACHAGWQQVDARLNRCLRQRTATGRARGSTSSGRSQTRSRAATPPQRRSRAFSRRWARRWIRCRDLVAGRRRRTTARKPSGQRELAESGSQRGGFVFPDRRAYGSLGSLELIGAEDRDLDDRLAAAPELIGRQIGEHLEREHTARLRGTEGATPRAPQLRGRLLRRRDRHHFARSRR